MSVVEAVRRELEALTQKDRDSALAAMALVLAKRLDDESASVSATAAAARELREALDRLNDRAPAHGTMDGIDDIAAARNRRRSGLADS